MFLQVLELVMTNNIFSFGDTTWLQLTGTAMGTPAACAYATITYGQHENTKILTEFSSNLLYYKRYIDDIFAIWIPSKTGNNIIWKNKYLPEIPQLVPLYSSQISPPAQLHQRPNFRGT